MLRFPPVDLPVCEPGFRHDRVESQIHGWAGSPAMAALVSSFGGTLPSRPAGELLGWLDEFSARHWDFRAAGHVERDEVPPCDFEPSEAELIRAAATSLQLVNPTRPPRRAYDFMVVLGGLARACLQRTEFAADLIRTGAVEVPAVAALGSFRPLRDDERDMTKLAGLFEVDAMDTGARDAFGLHHATAQAGQIRIYRPTSDLAVHVLAAPSSDPERRRANTADTYAFWADHARLKATDRILVITSPIYVPFQHCDAIRMLALPHGCGIDTIGFDPARATVPLAPGSTDPHRYLQEIRSAIRSMRALLTSCSTSPTG